jgi:hypothetical protein
MKDDEYIIRLTQIEAEALTYILGEIPSGTPLLSPMFGVFINNVFHDNGKTYNYLVKSGNLDFYYEKVCS